MRSFNKILIVFVILIIFVACSGEDTESETNASKGHVWKGQTDQIDKAKEVEGIMLDAAKQSEKMMEQQAN